ncbi:MAG: formylglycine-generating enzyme family protein [Chloroflexi bacterium]|nr:formylglycine-generating enzyme family protein [Chloroflexota bacterium]
MEDKAPGHVIIWERDGKEMVYIPEGDFLMGSDESLESERPAHTAYVRAFYVDRYPVTNEEYKRFVDATGHPVPCYDVEWAEPHDYNWDPEKRTPPEGREKHPVVLVGWEDARAYAAWAGKRLPTEAEWERAARGTDGRRWPWGNEFIADRCNTGESDSQGTTPVGQYSPEGDSPEGVGDTVGNVWEWTSSLFRPYPYDANDGRESQQADGWRTLRGGSWRNDLDRARCTARLDGDFLFFNNVGFRCVAPVEENEHESEHEGLFRKVFAVPRQPKRVNRD